MKGDKIKALIYCRVSSKQQVLNGHGLSSQELRCRDYADQKGYDVVKVFPDKGLSGALFDRPAMKELIEYLDKNKHDKFVVIFDDLSRFARDVQVHFNIKAKLTGRGATVECLNFQFEDTPEGKYVETVMAAGAELERNKNTRQVCQRMKARFEAGYWTLPTPPLGYEFENTKEHGKLLVPIQQLASVIKEGLEGFADNWLVTKLDMMRFFSKNKDKMEKEHMYPEYVSRVFRRLSIYAGYIEYEPWGVTRRKGYHQAIISEDTLYKIERKLERNKPIKLISKTDKPEFPLRGLFECAVCGKKVTASTVKGKNKYYSVYTCNNKACTAKPKNIQKHIVEEKYEELLEQMQPSKDILELNKAISIDVWNKEMKNVDKNRDVMRRETKEKEAMIEKYMDRIGKTSNGSLISRYEEEIDKLESAIKDLEHTEINLQKNLDFETAINHVSDFVGTPLKYWKSVDLEGKYKVHNMIFEERPRFDLQNGFGTPQTSVVYELKQDSFMRNPAYVETAGIEPAC